MLSVQPELRIYRIEHIVEILRFRHIVLLCRKRLLYGGKYAAAGVVTKGSRGTVAGSPQTKGIDPDRAWQKGGAGPEKSLTDGEW